MLQAPHLQLVLPRLSLKVAPSLLRLPLGRPRDQSCLRENQSQTWYVPGVFSFLSLPLTFYSRVHLTWVNESQTADSQHVCCLQTRPFSPPVSGSPPPFAPLARAESSSSISSITTQSAATTPTLGRDLNMSATGTTVHPVSVFFFFPMCHISVHVVCCLSLCPCLMVLSLSIIPCCLRGLTASGMV